MFKEKQSNEPDYITATNIAGYDGQSYPSTNKSNGLIAILAFTGGKQTL